MHNCFGAKCGASEQQHNQNLTRIYTKSRFREGGGGVGGGEGGLLGFCGSALHTMPRGFKRILMHFVLCFVFFLFWSPSVFVAFLT